MDQSSAWQHRRGLTRAEMIISISLGAILLLTCLSGLRMTVQALIASRQRSHENSMLRIGIEQALAETDFWEKSDDPLSMTGQPLRGHGVSASGHPGGDWMPFTPFAQTNDYANDPVNGTTGFQDGARGFDEIVVHAGWNPNPLAWAAWNPRTWIGGNVLETTHSCPFLGTCDIYDNIDRSKSWHYWYDDQVLGLLDALGCYGLIEYMPSNAYFVYHGLRAPLASPNRQITCGSMPASPMRSGMWEGPCDGDDFGMAGCDHKRYRYFMPGERPLNTRHEKKNTVNGYNGRLHGGNIPISGLTADDPGLLDPADVTEFRQNSAVTSGTIPLRPMTWNEVTVETHRYLGHGHPFILNLVSCRSAQSGKSFVISFTCLGTTLRGARQQRSPHGGWVVNPYTEATLDYQTPP